MPFVIAAVVLVGAVAVLNLALTMAVIRRLRRNEQNMMPPPMESGPPVGSALPEFSAESLDGAAVSRDALSGSPAVFAFLSTTCSACKPSIPHLVEYTKSEGLKPSQVVAVIGGQRDEADEILTALDGCATAVVEEPGGAISSSFDINAFPSFVFADAEGNVARTRSGSGSLIER